MIGEHEARQRIRRQITRIFGEDWACRSIGRYRLGVQDTWIAVIEGPNDSFQEAVFSGMLFPDMDHPYHLPIYRSDERGEA